MQITEWIQSIGIFLAIIGLIITILYNRKQVKMFNNQLKLNFFAEYTKRYQEIILNLPESINKFDFEFSKLSEEDRNKTLRYMRIYFDLCSEEYDLWMAGYIEERIWKNWKEGIEYAFSKKAYRDAWNTIELDTYYYPDFTKWMKDVVLKSGTS